MSKRKLLSVEKLVKHENSFAVLDNSSKETTERRKFNPFICEVFKDSYTSVTEAPNYKFKIHKEAQKRFPDIINKKVKIITRNESLDDQLVELYSRKINIGIIFSGGPAPGGHNVIAGIYDAAKKMNPKNKIYGFLLGPSGLIENEYIELTKEIIDKYRNIGGFSMIKTGREKIDTKEKISQAKKTCKAIDLKAVVIIGGDDSNTNVAFMAQEFYNEGIQVIGVPKTIDGDLQVKTSDGVVLCAMSFGFHTAARAFSQSICNLCTDSSSDVKYWHICKVMGRVASHLALEVALQTHPNMTLIGEDLSNYIDKSKIKKSEKIGKIDYTAYGMTLRHLSRIICDGIVRRSAVGKNFGVIVIPEGVFEFINEIQVFIIKLNSIINDYNKTHDVDFHTNFPLLKDKLEYLRRLAKQSRENETSLIWNFRDDDLFDDIPSFFQEGLLMERDQHGNFQFSQVETDKVIMDLVRDYLNILKEEGVYKIGLEKSYFIKKLKNKGLSPDYYGPLIFENYHDSHSNDFLLRKKIIISKKTMKQALIKEGAIKAEDNIPSVILSVYRETVPKFKTQPHFYGYDGRGNNPTKFDCNYTYNLGLTAFSLIINGCTGMMAAIKNIEKDFSEWEPIGIPLAPLMHLEERGGKMSLVIEKSLVDLNSNAFRIVEELREKWLSAVPGDDQYRKPSPIRFSGNIEEDKPITLVLNSIKE